MPLHRLPIHGSSRGRPARRWRRSLVVALVSVALILLLAFVPASAATPAPGATATPVASVAPSTEDTRTSGEGAGLAGQPFLAVIAVLVIGLAAAGGATLYVRLTGRP